MLLPVKLNIKNDRRFTGEMPGRLARTAGFGSRERWVEKGTEDRDWGWIREEIKKKSQGDNLERLIYIRITIQITFGLQNISILFKQYCM